MCYANRPELDPHRREHLPREPLLEEVDLDELVAGELVGDEGDLGAVAVEVVVEVDDAQLVGDDVRLPSRLVLLHPSAARDLPRGEVSAAAAYLECDAEFST